MAEVHTVDPANFRAYAVLQGVWCPKNPYNSANEGQLEHVVQPDP